MTKAVVRVKPYARNSHVASSQCCGVRKRFEEGEVVPAATPRHGFLFRKAAEAMHCLGGGRIAGFLLASAAVTFFAAQAARADVVDETISTAGTKTFEAGSSHGFLLNNTSGEVVLESSGGTAETDAVSFTNFNAKANAKTTFNGGWWDFGVLAADVAVTNFFAYPSSAGGRTTTLDNGVVVTNVGCVYLAGSSGTDNTLELKGGSSMTMRQMFFGSSTSAQRSKCVVSGGSSLHCLGLVSMSETSARDRGKNLSGNEFTVMGEGTHLQVDGTLCLGRTVTADGVNGSIGGNTFSVTDGAVADLHGVSVAASNVHGMKNHVVFGRNSRVNMTSFNVNSANSTVGPPNYFGSNTIEIVDGAVVTNTGNFGFGYYQNGSPGNNKSNCGNLLVVSNATFVTKGGLINNYAYLFRCSYGTIRLSGESAKLKLTGGVMFFMTGHDNTFAVENGATYNMPNDNISYSLPTSNNTIVARGGGRINLPNGFRTGTNGGVGREHALIAEDGGTIAAAGALYLCGTESRAEVDDGTIMANGNDFMIGQCSSNEGTGTNCVLEISGSHPYVFADWNVQVLNGSRIVINLPAAGYDEGYATSAKAVVMNGVTSTKSIVFDDTSSTLVLNGAEAMLERHRALRKKAEYVLLSARNNVSISDEKLAALQAALPEKQMSVFKRTKSNRSELVLSVKPKFGMTMIFR